MRRLILFWALLVLIAAPAWGADTNKYPHTIMDQTCTDSFDAPAAETLDVAYFGKYNPSAAVQLTGNPDGFCDNDSRIQTGALTADTTYGPFELASGYRGFYLFADFSALDGTANFHFQVKKPHEAVVKEFGLTANIAAPADEFYMVGAGTAFTSAQSADEEDVPIPVGRFYIMYNEIAATTATFELSVVPFR